MQTAANSQLPDSFWNDGQPIIHEHHLSFPEMDLRICTGQPTSREGGGTGTKATVRCLFNDGAGDLVLCHNCTGDILSCPAMSHAIWHCPAGEYKVKPGTLPISWVEVAVSYTFFDQHIQNIFPHALHANVFKHFAHVTNQPSYSLNLAQTQRLGDIKLLAQQASPSHLLIMGKLMELLSLQVTVVARQAPGVPQGAEYHPTAPFLAQYIARNLHRQVTVEELAREAAINQTKLKAIFREAFGQPVFAYIFSKKMALARDLLCHHDLKVQEVAAKVGYKNPTHFSKAFKQHFGYLPREVK